MKNEKVCLIELFLGNQNQKQTQLFYYFSLVKLENVAQKKKCK